MYPALKLVITSLPGYPMIYPYQARNSDKPFTQVLLSIVFLAMSSETVLDGLFGSRSETPIPSKK